MLTFQERDLTEGRSIVDGAILDERRCNWLVKGFVWKIVVTVRLLRLDLLERSSNSPFCYPHPNEH